jgi:hypothetical protein
MQEAKIYNQSQPAKAESGNSPTGKTAGSVATKPQNEIRQSENQWYGELRKPTDWFLVIFSGLLVLYTRRLYTATSGLFTETAGLREAALEQSLDMKTSIALAGDTAKRQLRAYVGVARIHILHTDGDWQPNVRVNFKNFGQTPAYKVANRFNCTFSNADNISHDLRDRPNYSDLGPTQDMTCTALITQADWTKFKPGLLDGTVKLFVYGEITYHDAFGDPHFSRYRVQLSPDDEGIKEDSFFFCPEGNESS